MGVLDQDLLWAKNPDNGTAHVVEGDKPRTVRPRNTNVYIGVSGLCGNHVEEQYHQFDGFDDIDDGVEICQMCRNLIENARGESEPFSNV